MTGNPNADITIPVVKKIHNSTHALLAESKFADIRREMTVGIGDRK